MRTKAIPSHQEIQTVFRIDVKASRELYELIARAADEHDPPVSMGQILLEIAAEKFGRADLAHALRRRMGRPRKAAAAPQ